MTVTPAQEAIAILLDLAQRGEIDPWDVRVIEVIDRYLSKQGLMGDPESECPEADLPKSGQAFLWASMLVLLKAETLQRLEEDQQEESDLADPGDLGEENGQRSLPVHLERHIRRRPSAPPPRRRPVTLQELIEQIQQIEAALESAPSRSRPGRPRPQSRRDAARAIAQLAHNENLTEVATHLEQFLTLHLPQLAPGQACVDLDQLLEWWSDQAAPASQSGDRVGVFWALLLLSAQSKVELSQKEFYQDLKIRFLSR